MLYHIHLAKLLPLDSLLLVYSSSSSLHSNSKNVVWMLWKPFEHEVARVIPDLPGCTVLPITRGTPCSSLVEDLLKFNPSYLMIAEDSQVSLRLGTTPWAEPQGRNCQRTVMTEMDSQGHSLI